jgi:hypothetical protein
MLTPEYMAINNGTMWITRGVVEKRRGHSNVSVVCGPMCRPSRLAAWAEPILPGYRGLMLSQHDSQGFRAGLHSVAPAGLSGTERVDAAVLPFHPANNVRRDGACWGPGPTLG